MRTWQTIRAAFGRHSHRHAYAALVLSGSYEEAGDSGRHRVCAGDVILHDDFEAHLDRLPPTGAAVLNLPLPAGACFRAGLGTVADLEAIVGLADKSRAAAAELLLATVVMRDLGPADWPEALAAAMARDASVVLSSWADGHNLSPWELSRGFAQVFGISPCAFRARARARHAWKAIRTTGAPLATIAADLGFADQPHMTRSIVTMTGRSPSAWRACK